MSDIALRTVGLGKMYHIGEEREKYRTLRDAIVQGVKRPLERVRHPGAATHTSRDLWALRNVDVEFARGEAVGIIGRNGAGKTTLLKLLSRITKPTQGRVEMRGRVASLLEVGTGFHPELTGRENIQLNAAILGMSRAEMKSKFDEIVAFSEIGRFLDTPVKRYSSGMYVRLAFAVAAHLEPEVLIVDEVLAVGDFAFQRKCLGKMEDVAGCGRTVLFVSHNLAAVTSLCSRGVLLDRGEIVADGAVRDVVGGYVASGQDSQSSREWPADQALGDERGRLLRIELRQDGREAGGGVRSSKATEVVLTIETNRPSPKLQVGLELLDSDGIQVFQTFNTDGESIEVLPEGIHVVSCEIPARLLNEGRYIVRPLVALFCEEWLINKADEAALRFDVTFDHSRSEMWYHARSGVLAPHLPWSRSSAQGGAPYNG
jgi:lipopolysaccharide transport system ATP-binding protein